MFACTACVKSKVSYHMFAPNLITWQIYKRLFVNPYVVAFCKFSLGPISLQHSSSIKYSIFYCFFLFLFFSTFDFFCLLVRLMQSLSRSKVIFARSKNQPTKKNIKKFVNQQQHILRPTFNLVASTIFRWVVVRSNSNMFRIQSNSISNCLTCLTFMSKHQFRIIFVQDWKK